MMKKRIADLINNMITKLDDIDEEKSNLLRLISKVSLNRDIQILDVGCGFGGKIKFLNAHGYNVTGVELNETTVVVNKDNGIRCFSVPEFASSSELYDVIIMSHIIEHFFPDDLIKFIDNYLKRLKPNGYLIIATPLNSPYFYDDFDHIKPYSPVGISQVFGHKDAQIKYYASSRLELMDLWYRKSPYRIFCFRGRFLGKGQYHIRLFNVISSILFRVTFHNFGRCDGWMGLYKNQS